MNYPQQGSNVSGESPPPRPASLPFRDLPPITMRAWISESLNDFCKRAAQALKWVYMETAGAEYQRLTTEPGPLG